MSVGLVNFPAFKFVTCTDTVNALFASRSSPGAGFKIIVETILSFDGSSPMTMTVSDQH